MGELWRTRLVWTAIGSAATVAIVRLSTPSPLHEATTPASAGVCEPAPPRRPTPNDASATTPPPPPLPSSERVGAGPPPVVVAPKVTEAAPPPARASTSPGVVPAFPLPRMPGMRTLRRSKRFDPELARWVVTRAQRVPAPVFAVVAFYTKALEDQGMSVSQIDEPPDSEGTRRVTLRARGRSGKAQIAIRQPAGELRTTARIIWQPSP